MRTKDAKRLNEIVNHPEVHKWTGAKVPLDFTETLKDDRNYCFLRDDGGFLCMYVTDGVYEVHTLFLPKHEPVVDFLNECRKYMFEQTNCDVLITQLPDNNPRARALALKVGFVLFQHFVDPVRGSTWFAKYTKEDWLLDNAKELPTEEIECQLYL